MVEFRTLFHQPENTMYPKLSIIVLVLLTGCSGLMVNRTDISGVADPLYQQMQYRSVLIRVDSPDLILRKQMEAAVVDVFRSQGVSAFSDVLLFPPTREWDSDRIRLVYNDRGIQAMLVLHDFEFGADSVYIPGRSQTTRETEAYVDTTRRGKPIEKKNTTVTTTYTEPRVDSNPWFRFGAILFDVKTDEKAWVASGRTQGDAGSAAIGKDLGSAVFLGLLEYGLVPEKK